MEQLPTAHDAACRNCSTPLVGPYCAQCGQHAHESARSLHVLLHDAWHLITHLDGNIWATLVPLMIRPGRLTQEYFADHRARFVPPFRLYFVISVAFFAIASLSTTSGNGTSAQRAGLSAADRAQLQRDLHSPDVPTSVSSTVALATNSTLTPELEAQLCARLATGSPRFDLRLQTLCKHQVADQGKSMLHEFGSLVPKMMFVFLPLVALAMLALYHAPRRYYVEHLVFLLHVQSNLFLTMLIVMLLDAAANAWPILASVASVISVALFWYAVWYVCCAMHRFYGQGWTRTGMKFVAVGIVYLICFALAMAGTLVISALVT
jgi:hypothetical protein